MKRIRISFLAVLLTCSMAVAMVGGRANAQYSHQLPTTGGGTDTIQPSGGDHFTYTGTCPTMRPVGGPTAAEFSTNLEFESWKTDSGSGVMKGNRQTVLAGYNKSTGNNELAIVLPYEFLDISGIQKADRFSDAEVSLRHYTYSASDPTSTTVVYGLKFILPTGSMGDGIGLGRWGVGPTATVSKPCGHSLVYLGGNYLLLNKTAFDQLVNPYFVWIGDVTQLNPTTNLQVELTKFRSPGAQGRDNMRILVGPRFSISPTAAVQVNVKQELQAGGKDTTISIGYSNRI